MVMSASAILRRLKSATSSSSRVLLMAGDQTQLIVFEGLPHCFWNNSALPESHEAWGYMANFFDRELGVARRTARR